MTYKVFPSALLEATYMGTIVFVVSNLWGNRIGGAFARKYTNPKRTNLPMAFFWTMFAAAPFTHWICGKMFHAPAKTKSAPSDQTVVESHS